MKEEREGRRREDKGFAASEGDGDGGALPERDAGSSRVCIAEKPGFWRSTAVGVRQVTNPLWWCKFAREIPLPLRPKNINMS